MAGQMNQMVVPEEEGKLSSILKYKVSAFGYSINIWLLLLLIAALSYGVMHYRKTHSGNFFSETSSSMNDILNNMKDTLQTPSFVKN